MGCPCLRRMFLSVEVAKNPEADHASARWHSLPSDVPIFSRSRRTMRLSGRT